MIRSIVNKSAILGGSGIFILLLLGIEGIKTKVYGFLPDIILSICAIIIFYKYKTFFKINNFIYSMIILGFILHATGVFGWYNISPLPIQWDHITHFFGILPWAMLTFKFLEKHLNNSFRNDIFYYAIVFFVATGLGAMVELSEFLGYLKLGFGDGLFMFGSGDGITEKTGMELIDVIGGGWINTGWDLLFNSIGALAGIFLMLCAKSWNSRSRNKKD